MGKLIKLDNLQSQLFTDFKTKLKKQQAKHKSIKSAIKITWRANSVKFR